MQKIIKFIIDQQLESLDEYPNLVLPISETFGIEVSCAQSIIDTVIEWETDANTINSLEELLTKRFPDIVTI
jgi:hypothetical protein